MAEKDLEATKQTVERLINHGFKIRTSNAKIRNLRSRADRVNRRYDLQSTYNKDQTYI